MACSNILRGACLRLRDTICDLESLVQKLLVPFAHAHPTSAQLAWIWLRLWPWQGWRLGCTTVVCLGLRGEVPEPGPRPGPEEVPKGVRVRDPLGVHAGACASAACGAAAGGARGGACVFGMAFGMVLDMLFNGCCGVQRDV